jgi:hypothetical protein
VEGPMLAVVGEALLWGAPGEQGGILRGARPVVYLCGCWGGRLSCYGLRDCWLADQSLLFFLLPPPFSQTPRLWNGRCCYRTQQAPTAAPAAPAPAPAAVTPSMGIGPSHHRKQQREERNRSVCDRRSKSSVIVE